MANNDVDDFTARITFRITSNDRIKFDETEAAFNLGNGQTVILTSRDRDQQISQSDWLVLSSSGWPTEQEAFEASDKLLDALRKTLIHIFFGGDLGNRTINGGGLTNYGRRMIEGNTGRTVLNEIHGPMVFPTEQNPLFARISGDLSRSINGDEWNKVFSIALENDKALSEEERMAFDLYSGAHKIPESADAQFVLLIAAIEALLEKVPLPKAAADHIDWLITLTDKADLDVGDKDSLQGPLRRMRNRSILHRGRCLVREQLGEREYHNKSAEKFFIDCYDLRSRLLHGKMPYPTYKEVHEITGQLNRMVSDLLNGLFGFKR